MPARCVICKNLRDESSNRAMHRFPADADLKKAWIDSLFLSEDLLLLKGIFLCSDHFKESDFFKQPSGARTLKRGSVPSVVPQGRLSLPQRPNMSSPATSSGRRMESSSAKNSQKVKTESSSISTASGCVVLNKNLTSPTLSKSRDNIKACALEIPQTGSSEAKTASETIKLEKSIKKRNRSAYVGDITNGDFGSPSRAKLFFKLAKSKIDAQKKRIKALQQSNRRLKSRITNLKLFLTHL